MTNRAARRRKNLPKRLAAEDLKWGFKMENPTPQETHQPTQPTIMRFIPHQTTAIDKPDRRLEIARIYAALADAAAQGIEHFVNQNVFIDSSQACMKILADVMSEIGQSKSEESPNDSPENSPENPPETT